MDDLELRKLLSTKRGGKIPKLLPYPSPRKVEESLSTPTLSQYKRKKCQKSKIHQLLKDNARKKKIEVTRSEHFFTEYDIGEFGDSKHRFIEILRESARQHKPIEMPKQWEIDIVSRVGSKFSHKYKILIKELLEESKKEFTEHLLDHAVKMTIRDIPGKPRIKYQEHSFKYNGITKNFFDMIKSKKKLGKRPLFLNSLIIYIKESAARMFPDVIIRSIECNKGNVMDVYDFQSNAMDQIRQVDYIVSRKWYSALVTKLKNSKCLFKMNHSEINKFVHCATKTISLEIEELIQRSVKHFVVCIKNMNQAPCFSFEFDYVNDFMYIPSIETFISVFESIVLSMTDIGKKLLPIEYYLNLSFQHDSVQFTYNKWLLQRDIIELQLQLEDSCRPLLKQIELFQQKYHSLHGDKACKKILKFIYEMRTFDEGRDKITFFQDMSFGITSTPEKNEINFAIINQQKMITGLKKKALMFIQMILNKIIDVHITENESICAIYEEIASKLMTEPKFSTELTEQGNYITYAKTVLCEQLKERILKQITIETNLIEMTILSPEHKESNKKTLKWINKIIHIFKKNAFAYETIKLKMEENIFAKIGLVHKEIEQMKPLLAQLDLMDDINKTLEYLEYLRKFVIRLNRCDETVKWINKEESQFKMTITKFSDVEELKDHMKPFHCLVYSIHCWRRSYFTWMDGPFEYLDYIQIENAHEGYLKKIIGFSKYYTNKIKEQISEQVDKQFKGTIDDTAGTDSRPSPLKLCDQCIFEIKKWRPYLQLTRVMCNPALKQRHWDEMSIFAGFDITPNAGTTLRKIINQNLLDKIDDYEIISIAATKEHSLILTLNKMMSDWSDICFKTTYSGDRNCTILVGLDDIHSILDDHILKTITIRGSAFAKPFESEVGEWYNKIIRISATLEEWGAVQSRLLYLLPIFSSKDIIAQMPEESVMFAEITNIYRRYIGNIQRDSRVFEFASSYGVLEDFKNATFLLDKVNDGANDYLERKRLYFPRFFFLSNEEMLEILSETQNPLKVQPHLNKCFEGINKLKFDNDLNIVAMESAEGEHVDFVKCVSVTKSKGLVEKWLVDVEREMINCIRTECIKSFYDYSENGRKDWLLFWQGMIVLTISQIYWALDVHQILKLCNINQLQEFHQKLNNQLAETVAIVRDKNLSKLNSITVKSLIVIDVHAKDVIVQLIDKNISDENDFYWIAQMRYYLVDDKVNIKLINASIQFGYEYLGNTDRLVITPLTDRCYRTIVSAYYLHLNSAPEGPAGTGKTETTKDLAKAIAVQCVVFNCSDGLDYKSMGKFFKGLASCGAWACFDEFNRIDIEVLSVIAQQILSIMQAVKQNLASFMFEGTKIELNPACYVCITMNPGYAGRSELPDNLKVLFRTVAMMVPDYAMIGEISLYSFGFLNARNLSVKIVTTYRLCSEQLSSQNHYDYGMRAVKTVLSAAGNLKRSSPNSDESVILLKSIIDVNLPKFLSNDVQLFKGIVSDLFPCIEVETSNHEKLLNACNTVCSSLNIQPENVFLSKIIQTYEMMIVRHGFMLVGDTFSGKSSTIKVLAKSLTLINEKSCSEGFQCTYEIINPKAVTLEQLYGSLDPISHEWSDGIIATIFRNYSQDDSLSLKWLIFDGPVDAEWIENMNTVLDDNKKLCLISGEVISMTSKMSMIFEVMELSQASPATVSRCGMIYMESASLGFEPFYISWLDKPAGDWMEGYKHYLKQLCDWLIEPLVVYCRKNCKMLVTCSDIHLVTSTLRLIRMTMEDIKIRKEDLRFLKSWILASFITGLVWGISGTLDQQSREKFDEEVKSYIRGHRSRPPDGCHLDIVVPQGNMIIDHYYVYRGKGWWKLWINSVKEIHLPQEVNLWQTVVPTVETVQCYNLLRLHTKFLNPLLFIGPTGTGKTFLLQNYLMNVLDYETYAPGLITFTTTTTGNQTQALVLSKLLKRTKNHYGPPKGKIAVIYVDDMNLPAKDKYGSQPAIELLRFYLEQNYWFNVKTNEKQYIKDTVLFGAIGIVGGSRQLIYPRMLRHYNIYAINEFSTESISTIFTTLLQLAWKDNGFSHDVHITIVKIIVATVSIFRIVFDTLRPTPMNSHYIFNLRDIGRVIQGCSLMRKESVKKPTDFIKLWVHEVMRVFYDRLTNNQDREWFFIQLKNVSHDNFKQSIETALESYKNEGGLVTDKSIKNLIFGSFLDTESLESERRYEEIPSKEAFLKFAVSALQEYNSMHKTKMNIALFDFALQHLSRLCRVLTMPSGNALLIGVAGSGRQSLTRLGSAMLGLQLFQPEVTKNYGIKDWHEDIKKVLKESGGFNNDHTFLFTENQITYEAFIQNIDNLLNIGEVPNLYSIDEKQELTDIVRLAAQGGNRNLDINPLKCLAFFTHRCKIKLHIVLCLSPIGNMFRKRIRLYPSLVNCCTVDWYDCWPANALEMVGNLYLNDVCFHSTVKVATIEACKQFHLDARDASQELREKQGLITYITSAAYIYLIKTFTSISARKQKDLHDAKNKYINGLNKLNDAAEAISKMKIELNKLQPQLEFMANKSAQMAKKIEIETATAKNTSIQVKVEEKIAYQQAAKAKKLKRECEIDLAQVLPIYENAISALNTLKQNDITIIKSMKNPPATVKLVMAAICVIKGVSPDKVPDPNNPSKKILDYWGPSKRILGDIGFLESLKNFDKDNISESVMVKIRKDFINDKKFDPKIVAKASTAAEGLCEWIIAINKYDAVVKVIAPKKSKLAKAELEHKNTNNNLKEKKALVLSLEYKLNELNVELDAANYEKSILENNLKQCSNKLTRAEKLINGLGAEKIRWQEASIKIQKTIDTLAGDVLISAAVIAYLAPYTLNFRAKIIDKWRNLVISLNIPHSDQYLFKEVLGTDLKIQKWCISGLPADQFSIDNAIIQENSLKWSLLIDPQSQANKWIKTTEKNNNLQILSFSVNNYMKSIEFCLEYGIPVLIQNIQEDIEVSLDPILYRNTYLQNGKLHISIGDSVLQYNPNFRLYLTTKLKNPHFYPEVFNKVTVINFALNQAGLEDQLLGIVVAKERPALQEQRQLLITEQASNVAALNKLENDILRTMQESKGDILDDESAIDILDSSKNVAKDIKKKQEASLDTEQKIQLFRKSYEPIASYSAVFYYCVTELPNINAMYQFSLNWFINIYIQSIENANKSKTLEKRLNHLKETFTYNLYSSVCRSLFQKDKLLFAFLMCIKLLLSTREVMSEEYQFLLTGGETIENQFSKVGCWLSDKSWNELCRLDKFTPFHGLKNSFINCNKNWKEWFDDLEPQKKLIPDGWDKKLTAFQKLLIMRVLRPDKLTLAISQFIENQMGKKYINPPGFNLNKCFDDSNYISPLMFILSPGSDPFNAISKLSEKFDICNKIKYISLGQGQGSIAKSMIEMAQIQGEWICLQNCHLAKSWLPTLEGIVENIDSTNTDLSFRLWLTSYPIENFPPSLLQTCIKITNELPTGLKNNLLRSYLSEPISNPSFYDSCSDKSKTFNKLLYGLSFFNAIVQERKKFGALGWNCLYSFDDSDYQISILQLHIFLNQYQDIQFTAIKYLTGECNYGGRVTDDWDRRLLLTILDDCINENIVQDHNFLFSDLGPQYGLPRRYEYRDYVKHIESIPVNPPAEVFGLHLNADIIQDQKSSTALLNSLALVEGMGSSQTTNEAESVLLNMVNSIISKLPAPFDLDKVLDKYPVDYNESMNIVLFQEMERFNKLINLVKTSLFDIEQAIRGYIVMTPIIETQSNFMLLGKIPQNWLKLSYPSLKPLPSYVTDLVQRLHVLEKWYLNGKPSTYWISGFFFTQAFLTGSMQNYARRHGIPIDHLVFDFDIRKRNYEDTPADIGVFVNGLFMDGARWDRSSHTVSEQYPKILFDEMPAIRLFPKLKTDFLEGTRYKCPLYKTLERKGVLTTTGHSSNFVLAFYLPTDKHLVHWIKRSVALLLQLDD